MVKKTKKKQKTINPKNNDNQCFQFVVTAALNDEQIKSHSERRTKVKPFTEQCNWKEIDFPSNKKDWKRFELNNKSVAFNILFVSHNNQTHKNQEILLVITNGEKWHYIAVNKLFALL